MELVTALAAMRNATTHPGLKDALRNAMYGRTDASHPADIKTIRAAHRQGLTRAKWWSTLLRECETGGPSYSTIYVDQDEFEKILTGKLRHDTLVKADGDPIRLDGPKVGDNIFFLEHENNPPWTPGAMTGRFLVMTITAVHTKNLPPHLVSVGYKSRYTWRPTKA